MIVRSRAGARRLALSKDVHDSTSIAAIGVATHEAGHAIQHAAHYAPLWLRSTLVPTANIGSSIGYVVMMIGLFMASQSLVGIGTLLFSAVLLFQVVTLPVEFDATARAKKLVVAYGIISDRERGGMDRVLNAAALTYVAPAALNPTSDTTRETHRAWPRTPLATSPPRSGTHAACRAPRRHTMPSAQATGKREGGAGRTSVSQSLSRTGHCVRRTFADGVAKWVKLAIFLGKWRARQGSNLRPPA